MGMEQTLHTGSVDITVGKEFVTSLGLHGISINAESSEQGNHESAFIQVRNMGKIKVNFPITFTTKQKVAIKRIDIALLRLGRITDSCVGDRKLSASTRRKLGTIVNDLFAAKRLLNES
jgi:hypothetical protein